MRTFIVLFVLIFMVSGCATTQQPQKNWRGRSINDVMAERGRPNMKTQLPGGNINYVYTTQAPAIYSQIQNQQLTTLVGPNGQTIAVNRPFVERHPAPSLLVCVTTYQVNRSGVVVDAATRGDC